MLSLMILLPLLLITLNHPMNMVIILIIISINIATLLLFLINSSWVSFIIILMLIGGMLILFMYMASLTPNKTNPPMKMFLLPVTLITILVPTTKFNPINSIPSITIFPLYPPMMIFSVLYLFMLLFIIMLIINNPKTPLRSS